MNLQTQLKKSFNLDNFRLGQQDIINAVLAKKDTLAVLPTGGGKSLCYQFPAVSLNKLVIVISPLIALMKDQVNSLEKKGIPAGALYSGQTEEQKRLVFAKINLGGAFILYLSPERVQKEGFQKWILQREIALFAVDEAHCVSQWGHDFRAEYSELKILKKLRPDVPILALTASATPTVLDDVAKNLKLVKPERLVHGFYRPNLYYQVENCEDDDVKDAWLLQAIKQFPTGRVLVYCGTRKVAEETSAMLQEKFEKVDYYHAGLGAKERSRIQDAYINGDLRILVATNAFGMGIDQADVRLVVHYQMPANIDSLYQEMGRAGRDGDPSTCLMLYSKKDKGLQSFFIQNSQADKTIKDLKWRNLEALVSYSEGGECRHAEILTYYKDAQRLKKCGHCDSCLPNSDRKILEVIPQKVAAPLKLTKNQKKYKFVVGEEMSPQQQIVFRNLKNWRKEKANELDVPAFVIFGDKTLRELAQVNPQNIEELQNIYGIGEAKVEKFGTEILEELKRSLD
ncbi:ATP-dependent DNA helicase [bacterium]|nr:ATP-dependent DNA helicase [bacterium]